MIVRRLFAALAGGVLLAACQPAIPTVTNEATANASTNKGEPPTVPRTSIPVEFQGRWDTTAEDCASTSSITRLMIAADSFQYYESHGTVQRVTPASATQIEVASDYEGEGQVWTSTQTLQLADNGTKLTISLPGTDDHSLVRCD